MKLSTRALSTVSWGRSRSGSVWRLFWRTWGSSGARGAKTTAPSTRAAKRAAPARPSARPRSPRAAADLGCGPGIYLPYPGPGAVGVDAAGAMLDLATRRGQPLIRSDLEALPFRDRCLGGAWARGSYSHIARTALPLA